jgi:flagellar basal body-associated protein FliL
MKQKDIILIIVVVFVSAITSFFLSNMLFTSKEKRSVEVEKVSVITKDFSEVDKRYFNKKSLNPTQIIQIGENSNSGNAD